MTVGEARAVARYVRISPSKVNQVMVLVRGKTVDQAAAILRFTPKAAARLVSKVLESASANAEKNHDLRRENLYIARAFVDGGATLKRMRPRAMGRASMIRKRTSNLTVVLREGESSGE